MAASRLVPRQSHASPTPAPRGSHACPTPAARLSLGPYCMPILYSIQQPRPSLCPLQVRVGCDYHYALLQEAEAVYSSTQTSSHVLYTDRTQYKVTVLYICTLASALSVSVSLAVNRMRRSG